jgi:DNA topoisomerase IB
MEKKKLCSVVNCNLEAVRSISPEKAESVGFTIERTRRAYLCTNHYKELKKKTKKERRTQLWRWNV